ncbi:MAG: hypothetical protein LBM09_03030 [Candidatus Nomurabacteria bacterium]|jgi:cytoskeletal protein RodZ|nr:hypothetical protein [Candidatus Nomurabacteria bacterium]
MENFSENERGSLSGYVICVVLLAILLLGGVFLLKNANTLKNDQGRSETEQVKTENKTEEEKIEQSAPENAPEKTLDSDMEKNIQPESEKSDTTPAVVPTDTSSQVNSQPTNIETAKTETDDVPKTGLADDLAAIFGPVFVLGAGYAIYNYKLSRDKVRETLMKKP